MTKSASGRPAPQSTPQSNPQSNPLAVSLSTFCDSADLALESWMLALDSAAVIWLRMGRLVALDAAAMAESERMVAEKAQAAFDLPWQWLTGALGVAPQTVAKRSLAFYRTRVSANRRRLSRAPRARG